MNFKILFLFILSFALFLPLSAIERAEAYSDNHSPNKFTDIDIEFEIEWAWVGHGKMYVTFPWEYDLSSINHSTSTLEYVRDGFDIDVLDMTVKGQTVTLTRRSGGDLYGDEYLRFRVHILNVANPSYRDKTGALYLEIENPGGHIEDGYTNVLDLHNYQDDDHRSYFCLVNKNQNSFYGFLFLLFLLATQKRLRMDSTCPR